MNTKDEQLMDKLVSLAKRRGFVYQGSEIYGGLAGTWDYGPLGVALKNNIKASWRKKFVGSREDMYEVDAALLMNPKVWEASGHVAGFADPLVECQKCKKRERTDNLIKDHEAYKNFVAEVYKEKEKGIDKLRELLDKDFFEKTENENEAHFQNEKYFKNAFGFLGLAPTAFLKHSKIACPSCGALNWSQSKQFNMMFSTKIGAMEDSASTVYFRPETAQGIFVNFKNILDSFAPKLPFGMAQIGKAFRNEITPRDFVFRVREFEQMEIEYFIRESDWEAEFARFVNEMKEWMSEIGIDQSKVHELEVAQEDLAHYSKRTVDFEFDFPFGRKELYGLAYRTNFDLTTHTQSSGTKLEYFDQETGEKFIPHVIEPSFGVDRTVLALLSSVYREDEQNGEVRSYLALKPSIAPIIAAVSPLLKNKPELQSKAREVFGMLKQEFGNVMYDDNGNIGKRYRRQDEIGTPFCVVIDFDTLGQENPELADTVTVRNRDTGTQERISIKELITFISEKIS